MLIRTVCLRCSSSTSTKRLLTTQFFSTTRWRPTVRYSLSPENYLHGLAQLESKHNPLYLQRYSTPDTGEELQWKSKFLITNASNHVVGIYQPPPCLPLPVTFAPEGLSVEDYKQHVAGYQNGINVFVYILGRHKFIAGFVKNDGGWASAPFERETNVSKSPEPLRFRTTRTSPIFQDVIQYLNTHLELIEACPTFWYRSSREHTILNPTSNLNVRHAAHQNHQTRQYGEGFVEDESSTSSASFVLIPFSGDARWTALPNCPWPNLTAPEHVSHTMTQGLIEIA
eukprot:PhF_6_TR6258/c0_g1_i2/m.9467